MQSTSESAAGTKKLKRMQVSSVVIFKVLVMMQLLLLMTCGCAAVVAAARSDESSSLYRRSMSRQMSDTISGRDRRRQQQQQQLDVRELWQQQLTPDFYATSCPQLESIVAEQVYQASLTDPRMPASLLRLHFHDCFVNGCDGSVLLSGNEQLAPVNLNSLRGFDVIANIKAAVEEACPSTVSCADILALTARDSVVLASKPSYNPGWTVLFGRRDSLTASEAAAQADLPGAFYNVAQLNDNFANVGLSPKDVVVLSGAHTFGRVHCSVLDGSLYPTVDPLLNTAYASQLESSCPNGGSIATVDNLDPVTPNTFDNQYYRNLQVGKGTLYSDRILFNTTGESQDLVNQFAPYSASDQFLYEFGVSMVKMGNISPLTGSEGEIRKICSQPN